MSLIAQAAIVAAEAESHGETVVPAPSWIYGLATLIVFMLLLVLITRLDLTR